MLIWFIIGTVLILLEFTTPTFVLVFFGLGAWGAALTAYFFPGTPQEIFVFIVVTCLSLFLLRKKVKQVFTGFTGGRSKAPGTQNFAYLGHQAKVTKEILAHQEGEIFVGGSFWRAKANVVIPKDTVVVIEKQDEDDNLLLFVKSLD